MHGILTLDIGTPCGLDFLRHCGPKYLCTSFGTVKTNAPRVNELLRGDICKVLVVYHIWQALCSLHHQQLWHIVCMCMDIATYGASSCSINILYVASGVTKHDGSDTGYTLCRVLVYQIISSHFSQWYIIMMYKPH